MNNNFGEFLNQLIKDKGWTFTRLSKVSNISRMQIHRIITNKSEPTLYILNQISFALKIDISEYYKISMDFTNVEEYKKFKQLRELIEQNKNIDTIENYICGEIVGIDSGRVYIQLINYAKALVMCKKYKQYKKSLDLCYVALELTDNKLYIVNLEKYIISDVSFNVLSLIEYNYFMLNRSDEGILIARKIIEIVEKIYFSNEIPNMNVPVMILRTYIAMYNNVADYLFNCGRYGEAREYCEIGIGILNKNNSIYGMSYLYDILFQCNYQLGDIEKAKQNYLKVQAVCLIENDNERLKLIETRVAKNYKRLTTLI